MDCCFMFRKRSQHVVEGDDGVHSVKVFSYNVLRKATHNFSGGKYIHETLDSFPSATVKKGRFLEPPAPSTSPAAIRWFPCPPPAASAAGGWGNPGSRCVYSVGSSRVLPGGVLEAVASADGVLVSSSSSPVSALSGVSASSRRRRRARGPLGSPCAALSPLDPVAADPVDLLCAGGDEASVAADGVGWRLCVCGVRGSTASRPLGRSLRSKASGRIWRRRAIGTSTSPAASMQKDWVVISYFVEGMLKDGTLVAVKVLSATSRQGIREFLTELTAISDIKHENLVTLVGCCAEGSHRILVYNYLEKNSLSQTLLGSNYSSIQFDWKARVKIAVGVARGLAFLHEEIRPHIIHRDIKASNILLDKDLTPKISDFGLARLLPPNATHVSTRVAGTLGYLAPEYAIRGQVTKKSDIYSFGVLLLEIVCGRCNTNTRLPSEDQFLLEKTWALYEQDRLDEIIDADIDNDLDVEEACLFLKIGLLCTQDAMARRPHMSAVVRMLTGSKNVSMEKITRPAMITDFAELKISSKPQGPNQMSSGTSRSFTTTEMTEPLFSPTETPTQVSV